MGFKNFYVTLNESEEDYAKQTELGKKLGLEHKGKGVYENKSGDKYFYNKNSGTFKGWKGTLDPNNSEHHVKTEQSGNSEKLEHEVLQAKVADLKKKHPDRWSVEHEALSKKIGKEHGIREGLISDFAESYPKEESQKNLETHGKEIKEHLDERDTKKAERAKYVQEKKQKNEENVKIINQHLSDGGEIHVGSAYKPTIYNKSHAGSFKMNKSGDLEDGKGIDHKGSPMMYVKNGKHIGAVNNHAVFGEGEGIIKSADEYKKRHDEMMKPKTYETDSAPTFDRITNSKISHDVNSLKERNAENVKVINKHLSDGGKIDLHYEKSNGEHVYPKSLTKNDAGKIKVDNETGHIVDEKGKSLEDHEITYKVHESLHSGHVLGQVNNTHKIKEKEGIYSNTNDNLIKSEKDYVESYNDKAKIHGKVIFKNNLDHWNTDKKESDLSKNRDGSDFEEYDEGRFKKPEKVHERFQVHGHEFVVHSSKRKGGGYDKVSISHESGLPITPGTMKKEHIRRNVDNIKKNFEDLKSSHELSHHLKRLYSDVAIDGKFYSHEQEFKNPQQFSNNKDFVKPLSDKFEKYFGNDIKELHEKRQNRLHNGFTEKVGDKTYVDRSHFTPRGGMEGGMVVDRHNKTGRQVLYDKLEDKHYLGDKVVAPYDHEAFLKNPKDQVRYKTLAGEIKYTHGGHTEPFEHPKTPEDKHFSEVKKQQIEMAHNVIRGAYEKMDENEKKRAIEKLGSGNFSEENMTSEHGKRFNKAAGYLGDLSRSGLKQIHAELSGVPLEKKNPGKVKLELTDRGNGRDNKSKKVEIKHLDEFEHLGHAFVIHKRHYLQDGKLQSANEKVVSHKETGLSMPVPNLDKKDNVDVIREKTRNFINTVGKEKLDSAVHNNKNKPQVEDFKE